MFVGTKNHTDLSTFILKTNISDHFPVILNIKQDNTKHIDNKKDYTTTIFNTENIIKIIETETWNKIYTCKNANNAAELFVNTLKEVISSNKTVKVKQKPKILKPWITEGIIRAIKKRDKIHIFHKTQPFNTNLIQHYKKYRNKLNTIIEKAKADYFKKQITNAKGDKKKIWKTINEITQHNKKKENIIKEIQTQTGEKLMFSQKQKKQRIFSIPTLQM